MASKATKLGNWMIWMVHRAHLDDPTLVKFDPWQNEAKEVVWNLRLFIVNFNQTSGTPFFYFAWSFLDDLIAEDFTNLKMPDGNVEPLISPKLAVAMESPLLWNGQVASFILLYLFIQGRVSTTLLVLVLCGALDFLLQRMKVPQKVYW